LAFNKYFQDELAYLRDMGREFSSAYPALAPMLADRGGDPDVERLLEGFAFLTGRIREKLDDELPELMLSVSQLLFPQLLRPLPATTVLEFLPMASALREKRVVPPGTEVQSIAVDGTKCRFRTAMACTLAPLGMTKVQLQDLPAGRQELQLELRVLQPGEIARVLPPDLSLHFAGEPRNAFALLAQLLESLEEIVLFDAARGPEQAAVRLPASALRMGGFDEDEALLPQVETAFPGFRLLQEYYVLPAKFAFASIIGFDQVKQLGELQRIGVALRLKQRMRDVRGLGPDDVKLHAVPIVNVFETTAEPVRIATGRQRYLVRPAGLGPGHGDVYAISRVQTVQRGGERIVVPPFLSFEHAADLEDRGRLFYVEHKRSTVVGEGADTLISLGTAEDSGVIPDVEVLSLDLLATNGPLANALRAGEISEPTTSSPPFAKFRNLTKTTTYVPPPLGHDLQWRAMAHTAMNLRALTEVAVLRTVLGVYNLQAMADRQAARANELRIEAVREVRVKPSERIYRGAAIRGVDIHVEVDESGFSGDGDMFLFGSVLERIFAEYVSINSYSRTRIKGVTTNQEFSWPARSGNQTLL
jgi:type VI secretion system protein ImpG